MFILNQANTAWKQQMIFRFKKEILSNYNSKSRFRFLVFGIRSSKWSFLFFNVQLVTQKSKNENLTVELVAWSETFYFSTLN